MVSTKVSYIKIMIIKFYISKLFPGNYRLHIFLSYIQGSIRLSYNNWIKIICLIEEQMPTLIPEYTQFLFPFLLCWFCEREEDKKFSKNIHLTWKRHCSWPYINNIKFLVWTSSVNFQTNSGDSLLTLTYYFANHSITKII